MTKITEHEFNDTYKLYRHRVFGIAFKILRDIQLAEDVTQDTFMKLCGQSKEIKGDHQIQWLCVVARNTSLKILAKRKRIELCENIEESTTDSLVVKNRMKPACFRPTQIDLVVCEADPCSLLLGVERAGERGRALMEAVAKLPLRLQKLLKLRFFDRFSYAEIAKKTKLSKGNVGFLLNKATTTLRKKLNNARRDLNEV